MSERQKVVFGNATRVLLYESDRDIPMDEVREHCEANDIPVPEEDSGKYWDIVNDLHDFDWEIFSEELQLPENVVVVGAAGLWDGPREVCSVQHVEDPVKFLGKFIPRCACYEMRIGYDGDGLFVEVPHHDGTNFYHVREITPEGLKYMEKCDNDYCDPLDIDKEPYSRKIDWYVN